jgi:hypothetical protein
LSLQRRLKFGGLSPGQTLLSKISGSPCALTERPQELSPPPRGNGTVQVAHEPPQAAKLLAFEETVAVGVKSPEEERAEDPLALPSGSEGFIGIGISA